MATPGARGRSGALRVGSTLLGVLGLIIFVAFVYDIVWEPLFDESYFRWYLENGGVVNLLLGLTAIGASLDERPDLISADPDRYFQAWGDLVGDSTQAFGRAFQKPPEPGASRSLAVPGLDLLLLIVFLVFWTAVVLVFALVIFPAQYVVFLVAGAPARLAVDRAGDHPGGPYGRKPVTFTIAVAAIILFLAKLAVDL